MIQLETRWNLANRLLVGDTVRETPSAIQLKPTVPVTVPAASPNPAVIGFIYKRPEFFVSLFVGLLSGHNKSIARTVLGGLVVGLVIAAVA